MMSRKPCKTFCLATAAALDSRNAPQWLGSGRSNRFRCMDPRRGLLGLQHRNQRRARCDDSHIANMQLPARRYPTKIFAGRMHRKSSCRATRGSPIPLGGGCNSCVRAHPIWMAFGVGTGRPVALGAGRVPRLAHTRGRCPRLTRADPFKSDGQRRVVAHEANAGWCVPHGAWR